MSEEDGETSEWLHNRLLYSHPATSFVNRTSEMDMSGRMKAASWYEASDEHSNSPCTLLLASLHAGYVLPSSRCFPAVWHTLVP